MSEQQKYHFWFSRQQEGVAHELGWRNEKIACINGQHVRYSSCHKVSSSDDFGQCSCKFSDAKYLGVGVIHEKKTWG